MRVRIVVSIFHSQPPETNGPIVTPALNSTHHKRNELFNPFCGGGAGDTANVDDLIACFNYLQSIRGYECWIPDDHDQHAMCTCGSAKVVGVDIGDADTSSNWLKLRFIQYRTLLMLPNSGDVATAVQWVFTYCNSGGRVEGMSKLIWVVWHIQTDAQTR